MAHTSRHALSFLVQFTLPSPRLPRLCFSFLFLVPSVDPEPPIRYTASALELVPSLTDTHSLTRPPVAHRSRFCHCQLPRKESTYSIRTYVLLQGPLQFVGLLDSHLTH
ncbi:uncharacterized protein BDZ83DRAFT_1885 [Colletotrichum acutatum]|uniref:Uncharacterized protein n=1 Tax=Glomerella acutata TaxID=27357 RepID=A0AAD8XQ97_GLOAC|nr:uncharacterized protein BDZ83DRAFT_1885 [Colletotrichum acutatum]KAK1731720.1 hypothetical protein BDZ83DRAFT_1885 [Colletotrichum acutatum]